MGIMRYDSEVSSDVIKCHQMSLLRTTDEKKKKKQVSSTLEETCLPFYHKWEIVQRMKKKKQVSSTLEECLLHVFVKWVHHIKNPIYFNAYRIFQT